MWQEGLALGLLLGVGCKQRAGRRAAAHVYRKNALRATCNGALLKRIKRQAGVANQTQQHRQICPRYLPHLAPLRRTKLHQPLRHIAGSCAKQIGKHQQIALYALCKLAGCIEGVFGRGIGLHIKRNNLLGTARENVQRTLAQSFGQWGVGNDEDLVHPDEKQED